MFHMSHLFLLSAKYWITNSNLFFFFYHFYVIVFGFMMLIILPKKFEITIHGDYVCFMQSNAVTLYN